MSRLDAVHVADLVAGQLHEDAAQLEVDVRVLARDLVQQRRHRRLPRRDEEVPLAAASR